MSAIKAVETVIQRSSSPFRIADNGSGGVGSAAMAARIWSSNDGCGGLDGVPGLVLVLGLLLVSVDDAGRACSTKSG